MNGDTIFAPATGVGRAAIAVVRVSGPAAGVAIELFTGRGVKPRMAALRKFCDPDSGLVIDEGLVLWFPGPHSFTGEDSVEFQLHGGRAILSAMLAALGRMRGLRPAEPGEFTQRAFANGKMDLTQVEGLADMIDSETERQRRQAVGQFEGQLGARVHEWRAKLLRAQALVAAEIDFGDEEDVPAGLLGQIQAEVGPVLADLEVALRQSGAAEILREGFIVVIAGPPNVGKSSLLNRLAGREVAIVSPQAGTTRDVLEVRLEVNGVPILLVDTAGMRITEDSIEAEGVARAQRRARTADLVLWLDAGEGGEVPPEIAQLSRAPYWHLRTKADLAIEGRETFHDLALSAHTGEGVEALLQKLANYVIEKLPRPESGVLTRQRHVEACQRGAEALRRVSRMPTNGALELVSEDLQIATRALAQVVGAVDVEEVLGEIFSRFCIGK
ncbi:MAG: tRNA uridine-5-carboxymethylaminomethyl(34) synthesis GTPase MnmE [Hyphomicrobiales bacterium]|nr:tRNA uridine-5-carboxymethylaminomethyl(34) synthesis GTPase MnmE [Hyphomicrobiales bacterium]MDE2114121.1 tRNA uridine-5-carboxymethylaminomethyl(34) synthesis GTPase MnmE [Hyphomicrobiales bacterium]